jgi:copper chaperone CopZ
MRYGFFFSALVLLAFIIGCASSGQLQKADSWDGHEVRVYEVYGMDCPGCHGGVEKLVNKIPAVHDSAADWEKAELRVAVSREATLDDNDIYDAIRKANFTPGDRIM